MKQRLTSVSIVTLVLLLGLLLAGCSSGSSRYRGGGGDDPGPQPLPEQIAPGDSGSGIELAKPCLKASDSLKPECRDDFDPISPLDIRLPEGTLDGLEKEQSSQDIPEIDMGQTLDILNNLPQLEQE